MESNSDMLSRVCMMADGNDTWDLSDNDTRALRHVLAERDQFKQASELSDLRIRELEAQLAEARKDSARLDWFEKNHRYVAFSTGFLGQRGGWVWRDQSAAMVTHEADSLRAAIDAAIKESK